jgi:hypothetical protein
MANVQKHNICTDVPWSQILDFIPLECSSCLPTKFYMHFPPLLQPTVTDNMVLGWSTRQLQFDSWQRQEFFLSPPSLLSHGNWGLFLKCIAATS